MTTPNTGAATCQPAGITRPYGISFITRSGQPGCRIDYFDVPPQPYSLGEHTGFLAAAELCAAHALDADHEALWPDVIKAAIAVLSDGPPGATDDRRGAAAGFLYAVRELLAGAVAHGLHGPILSRIFAVQRTLYEQEARERQQAEDRWLAPPAPVQKAARKASSKPQCRRAQP